MTPPEDDLQLVAAFCAQASPAEHAAEMRVEYCVSGDAVTITEASRMGAERDEDWLRVPAARVRHEGDGRWTLFCFDSDSREQRYDVWEPDFSQPASMTVVLAEVDADPTGIFWG